MPRAELLDRTSSHELTAWQAFFRVKRRRDDEALEDARQKARDEVIENGDPEAEPPPGVWRPGEGPDIDGNEDEDTDDDGDS